MNKKKTTKNSSKINYKGNNMKKLSDSLMKKIQENEANSKYVEGLLKGERSNGGVSDEVFEASRKKARKLLDELMIA